MATFGLLVLSTAVLATPDQVFVDNDYTGPAACGGHVWHEDAFATIQEGLDAVAPGGTVTVAPGRYPEYLTIAKPLTLRGPVLCIDPNAATPTNPLARNSARGGEDEAVILPPRTNLDLPGGLLITVNADRVTIEGLYLDGDNPALTDGKAFNGADLNAAGGIGNPDRSMSGILIAHNIIRNCYRFGVFFANETHRDQPVQTNNAVLYNWIDNIPYAAREIDPDTPTVFWATGIRTIYQAFTVSQNTITRASWGIDVRNIMRGLGAGTPAVTRNRVQAYNVGINLILADRNDDPTGPGPELLCERNWVRITPRSTTPEVFRHGIFVRYIEDTARVLVKDNILSGGDAGIALWELPVRDGGQVLITGGTIRDTQYGIWFRNYIPLPWHEAARSSTAVVHNVLIENPRGAGLYLEDDARAYGPITIEADGLAIHGGPVGAWLKGGRAILTGNLSLTGQTDRPLKLETNGTLDLPLPDVSGFTAQ